MGLVGAATGAAQSLEEIVAQRMLRQKLEQEIAERQQRFGLDQQRVNEASLQNDYERKRTDRIDAEAASARTAKAGEAATLKNARSDMAGVMAMPGMSNEAKANEIMGSGLRTGSVDPEKVYAQLTKEPKKYSVRTVDAKGQPINKLATEEEMQAGVPEYREPKAGPKTPQFVRMPDGSVKDINGVAPPGAMPFDAVSERQQASTGAAGNRALEAMRSYGDNMLSVINELIDENGNLKPEAAGVIGGIEGVRPEWAYGSEASQGALANIDRLQSMLNINTLQDMKSQSRTGATGFGALSERELNVVESSASKLRRRRQGDANYASELKRLRDAIMTGRTGNQSTAPLNPNTSVTIDPEAAAQALIERARAARQKKP